MKKQIDRRRGIPLLAAVAFLAAGALPASAQPTNTVLGTVFVPQPSDIRVTPNNKYVYVVSNAANALYRIDTSTNTVESNTFGLGGNPQLFAITPKGNEVVVANPVDGYNGGIWGVPGTVSLITGAQGTAPILKAAIPGMGIYTYCVGVNPAGTEAWVGNLFEGDCSVVDLKNNTVLLLPVQTGSGPANIKFTPDGKNAYVANYYDSTVVEVNTSTKLIVGNPIPVGLNPINVVITPDGTEVFVTNYDGTVSVISTATNQVVASVHVTSSEFGNYWLGSAITPDGLYLYVPNQNAQSVVMVSTQTNTIVGSPITLGQTPGIVAIAPNGKHAYITQIYNWTVAIVQIIGA